MLYYVADPGKLLPFKQYCSNGTCIQPGCNRFSQVSRMAVTLPR
jgi:hypothetical protein